MDILIWIFFGIMVGTATNLIDKNHTKDNLIGSILLGISGSLFGGFLASILFGEGLAGFNINSFIVAIVGSLVLLYLGKEVRHYSENDDQI